MKKTIKCSDIPSLREYLLDNGAYHKDIKSYSDEEIAAEYCWQQSFEEYSKYDLIEVLTINDNIHLSFDVEIKQDSKKLGYTSRFESMNRDFSVSKSSTMHAKIKNNPQWWVEYHSLYKNARENWEVIPINVIANKIKQREDWIVADFGCGEHLLKKQLTNIVIGFDHYGIDDSVIVCDYLHTNEKNNHYDAAVFSLSLPKLEDDLENALKEAYRILKPYGALFVAEPIKRYEAQELTNIINKVGFKNINIINDDKWLFIDAFKGIGTC